MSDDTQANDTPRDEASTEVDAQRDVLPTRIGRYRILSEIGHGGMGVVYLAQQEAPVRRRVALKLIKSGVDSSHVLARFEAERQALAIMNHPSIAQVFDAGTTDQGQPYFVMEHVPGLSITEFCDRRSLQLTQRLELFATLCDGIHHAHQKGIIHRDIKPSNVLVSEVDGKPRLKVIDFGIAKATAQPLTERTLHTEQGVLLGTPEYMSPEQAGTTALDVDTRTDVYSLGVLLYELLAGSVPFSPATLRGAALAEMLRIIREEDPPKLTTKISSLGDSAAEIARRRHTDVRDLLRQIHGELEWITMRSLEKDPGRRYASASEFAADIGRFLRSEPVDAGPAGTTYRLKKLVKRHRAAAFGIAAVIAIATIGFLVSSTLFVREQSARIAEAHQREKAEWQSYIAGIALAQVALDVGDPAQARQRLLDVPERIRGWEWQQILGSIDASRETLALDLPFPWSDRAVAHISESLDGTAVYISHGDSVIQWDPERRRSSVIGGQPRAVLAMDGSRDIVLSAPMDLVFSTVYDANRMLRLRLGTSRTEFPVTSEALATGAKRVLFSISGQLVDAIAVSANGTRIAVATSKMSAREDKSGAVIRVHSTESGEPLVDRTVKGAPVQQLALSSNGATLAVAAGKQLTLLSVPDAGEPSRAYSFGSDIGAIDFGFAGRLVVAGLADGTMRLVRVSGRGRPHTLGEGGPPVSAIAVEENSDVVIAGAADGSIRTWNLKTERLVAVARGHGGRVDRLHVMAGGQRMVSLSLVDRTAKWWRTPAGTVTAVQKGQWPPSVSWDRNGERLAVPDEMSGVELYSASSLSISEVLSVADTSEVGMDVMDTMTSAAEFNPRQRELASGHWDGKVRLWDLETGSPRITIDAHPSGLRELRYDHRGSILVSTSGISAGPSGRLEDESLKVWNVQTGDLLWDQSSLGYTIDSADVSPRDSSILTSGDGAVSLWNSKTGAVEWRLEGLGSPVVFDPSGDRFFAADVDGGGQVRSIDGEEVILIPENRKIFSADFSPDGTRLVMATREDIAVWHAATGQEIARFGGEAAILQDAVQVRFSPDGTSLAVLGSEGFAVWRSDTPWQLDAAVPSTEAVPRSDRSGASDLYGVSQREFLAMAGGELGPEDAERIYRIAAEACSETSWRRGPYRLRAMAALAMGRFEDAEEAMDGLSANLMAGEAEFKIDSMSVWLQRDGLHIQTPQSIPLDRSIRVIARAGLGDDATAAEWLAELDSAMKDPTWSTHALSRLMYERAKKSTR